MLTLSGVSYHLKMFLNSYKGEMG